MFISNILDKYQVTYQQTIPFFQHLTKNTTTFLTPTLPMNFDRSLIPQDICQNQLLDLVQCLNTRDKGFWALQNKVCSNFVLRFNECKTRRDIILYDRIKTWEMERFKGLTAQNKQLYLQGLTFKLERLKEEYEQLPSLSSTQFLEKKLQHDEAEVRWRMRYLEKL